MHVEESRYIASGLMMWLLWKQGWSFLLERSIGLWKWIRETSMRFMIIM